MESSSFRFLVLWCALLVAACADEPQPPEEVPFQPVYLGVRDKDEVLAAMAKARAAPVPVRRSMAERLAELPAQSVAYVRVVSATSRAVDDGIMGVVTDYTFEVHRHVKGAAAPRSVTLLGGTIAGKNILVTPTLEPGRDYLVFFGQRGVRAALPVSPAGEVRLDDELHSLEEAVAMVKGGER